MKLIIKNSSAYIQLKRSLILAFLTDNEVLLEAYYAGILIKQAMNKQGEMEALLRDLDVYRLQNKGKKAI